MHTYIPFYGVDENCQNHIAQQLNIINIIQSSRERLAENNNNNLTRRRRRRRSPIAVFKTHAGRLPKRAVLYGD